MKPERKKITLPSGATLVMRRVTGMDYVLAGCAEFPDFLRIVSDKEPEKALAKMTPAKMAEWHRLSLAVIARCCSPLRAADGSKCKLVAKELDECGDDEMTLEELDQADFEAIQTAFTELSQEAGRKARPFPEQSQAAGDAAPAGENLPGEAVATPAGTAG